MRPYKLPAESYLEDRNENGPWIDLDAISAIHPPAVGQKPRRAQAAAAEGTQKAAVLSLVFALQADPTNFYFDRGPYGADRHLDLMLERIETEVRRPLVEAWRRRSAEKQLPRPDVDEVDVEDVIVWASSIQGTLGTEYADRVTPREAKLSNLILRSGSRADREAFEQFYRLPPEIEWHDEHWSAERGAYLERGVITPDSRVWNAALGAWLACARYYEGEEV